MGMLLRAAAAAMTAAFAALTVKKSVPSIASAASAFAAVIILFAAFTEAGEVVSFVREAAETAGISETALSAVFKTTGLALTARFASDVCKEAGALTAASAVETAGAAAGLLTALPLMRSVFNTVREML